METYKHGDWWGFKVKGIDGYGYRTEIAARRAAAKVSGPKSKKTGAARVPRRSGCK